MRILVACLALVVFGVAPCFATEVCTDQSTSAGCGSTTQHVTESGEPGWRIPEYALRFTSSWVPWMTFDWLPARDTFWPLVRHGSPPMRKRSLEPLLRNR
jgi:hypothetical protein